MQRKTFKKRGNGVDRSESIAVPSSEAPFACFAYRSDSARLKFLVIGTLTVPAPACLLARISPVCRPVRVHRSPRPRPPARRLMSRTRTLLRADLLVASRPSKRLGSWRRSIGSRAILACLWVF